MIGVGVSLGRFCRCIAVGAGGEVSRGLGGGFCVCIFLGFGGECWVGVLLLDLGEATD